MMDDTDRASFGAPDETSTDGRAPVSSRGDGVAAAHANEANRLLRALPIADYEWLLVRLTPMRLRYKNQAVMLGVRRAGVTVAMGVLQNAGIVRYTRGRVEVLDRRRLEEASCGCYRITQTSLDRLLGALRRGVQ